MVWFSRPKKSLKITRVEKCPLVKTGLNDLGGRWKSGQKSRRKRVRFDV